VGIYVQSVHRSITRSYYYRL